MFTLASIPQFMKDSNKIVGGQDAPSMIPWQVSVVQYGFPICGGTVLDAKTVLSAGHCFYKGENVNSLSIRAGSLDKHSGGQVNINLCVVSFFFIHWFIVTRVFKDQRSKSTLKILRTEGLKIFLRLLQFLYSKFRMQDFTGKLYFINYKKSTFPPIFQNNFKYLYITKMKLEQKMILAF